MQVALKSAIHRLTNQMQIVLSHLNVEPKCPLGYPCRETHALALKAARDSVIILHQVSAALRAFLLVLPPEGSVVVVPHGSQIVSHDDLIVDIAHDEVRVADLTEVRPGEAEHNPRSA